ncbi:MAG: hypothetical protein GU361_05025 [Desulfurococcales archaeon]|nr:hypothetical protein [Desulfurococcales archaeon]
MSLKLRSPRPPMSETTAIFIFGVVVSVVVVWAGYLVKLTAAIAIAIIRTTTIPMRRV